MSRANWLLDVLSDAFRGLSGFRVDYVPGWHTRGSSTLYPRGVMNHHTGAGSYNALLNYMSTGSSIAPLCNVATSRPSNGIVRITVVASGKANHAGKGYLPWTGTNAGNNYTIGFENQNDGSQTWPQQQNEAIAIANDAVLRKIGVGVDRLADHKTYAPTRKVDRVHIDLKSWQNYVANIGSNVSPGFGGDDVIVSRGAKGKIVERIQKDVNVLLTWNRLGPENMSTQRQPHPNGGVVGIVVDGDYGPGTAAGIKEVMSRLEGIDVSGDQFGPAEAYIFLRYGYYADDLRHEALVPHGGSGSVDTSGFATKTEVSAVDKKANAANTKADTLKAAYDVHRHAEGTTGPPK